MNEAIQNSEEQIDMVGPQLLHEEIVKALEAMKLGKKGVDVEMFKSLSEKATKELVQICQQIYTSGDWPVVFMQFVLAPLPTNVQECSDHHMSSSA